jgi:hypothetical protein
LSLAAAAVVAIEQVLAVLAVILQEQQTLFQELNILQLLAVAEQSQFREQILYLEV